MTISHLRPEVLAFAYMMEAKLQENDKRKRASWKQCTPDEMLVRLEQETIELKDALEEYYVSKSAEREVATAVLREAVDVANFAMFIADIIEPLDRPPGYLNALAGRFKGEPE